MRLPIADTPPAPHSSCARCNAGGNYVRWYPEENFGSWLCDSCVAEINWLEGPPQDMMVLIREEATKKVVLHRASGDYILGDVPFGHIYIWEEGNYSDDANRALFFGAVDDAFDYKGICGDTPKAYKVRLIWADAKKPIYEEYKETE